MARPLCFLCQVPWGSCAEFPTDMMTFPEGPMPVSMWFLCLVSYGSFAEFSRVRCLGNVPVLVYPRFLFLIPTCFLSLSPVVPEPGSVYFLRLIACGSDACLPVVPVHGSLRFLAMILFRYNACFVPMLFTSSSYTSFPCGFYAQLQWFL